jgi:hypothetical protein
MQAKHRVFHGLERDEKRTNWFGAYEYKYASSDELHDAVDNFLTELGKDRVISVSHRGEGALEIIVWYWE